MKNKLIYENNKNENRIAQNVVDILNFQKWK